MPPSCCAVSVSGNGSGECLHCRYLVENGGGGQGSLPLKSLRHRGNSAYNIGDKMHSCVPGLKLCTQGTCNTGYLDWKSLREGSVSSGSRGPESTPDPQPALDVSPIIRCCSGL